MPKPSSPQWDDHVPVRKAAKIIAKLAQYEWPDTPDGRAEMIAYENRAIAYAYRLALKVLSNGN